MDEKSTKETMSHSKSNEVEYVEEEEEEEEALSLCDLPINESNHQSKKEESQSLIKPEEEFEFGSVLPCSVLTESEMCAADELFFKGQILPLRHSTSSDSGLAISRYGIQNPTRSLLRSESMDHFHSGGFTSVVSSRSSSCSSSTTTTKIRNQFHSHPSPSPQIRIPSSRYQSPTQFTTKSSIWSFFKVGLVRTPEMGRTNNYNSSKSFGSRNSNSSTSSSLNNGKSKSVGDRSEIENNKKKNKNKKKKKGLFDRNVGFFGGCKYSVNSVETVVFVKKNNIDVSEAEKTKQQQKQKQNGKQAVSRHRTFEWLKELSVAGVYPDYY